jgi:hypothetical protein
VFADFVTPRNRMSEQTDVLSNQELIVATYQEQHDKWNKEVLRLEGAILALTQKLHTLKTTKDKWWEAALKLTNRKTERELLIEAKQNELTAIEQRYDRVLNNMPCAEAYELAMLGGCIFRMK